MFVSEKTSGAFGALQRSVVSTSRRTSEDLSVGETMVSIAEETACQEGPLIRRTGEPLRGSVTKAASAALSAPGGRPGKSGRSSAAVPTSTLSLPGPAAGSDAVLKAKIWFGILLSTDRPCASRSSGLVVPGCSSAGTTMSNSVLPAPSTPMARIASALASGAASLPAKLR